LRADLVADLREWLGVKINKGQDESRERGESISRRLPHDTPLFTVATGLIRILDRDLAAAGIPKKDERGRTLDVHALRHSFSTLLSKGGVPPRVAQAAMRHSDISLTMTTYTDPKLLDVHGALKALPALPLTHDIQPANVENQRSIVCTKVCPKSDKLRQTKRKT